MKVQVKEIHGNWELGYALAKHVLNSVYTGDNQYGHPTFDNTRSEPGEALYQMKYHGKQDQVGPLAAQIVESIYPLFEGVGLIVPMPASKSRPWQPVSALADEIGRLVGLNVFHKILKKTPTGKAVKDLGSKADRAEVLKGSITLHDEIQGKGPWNVMLIDDRYDTGASVEAACAVLRSYGKIGKIYVATATW